MERHHRRERLDRRLGLVLVIRGLVCALLVALAIGDALLPAVARDLQGRYAQSELHEWFNGLKSQRGGLCCSLADGNAIKDVDWEASPNGYRVRIDGKWFEVPPDALVLEPNKFGAAVVWKYETAEGIQIRCFMPGAGS